MPVLLILIVAIVLLLLFKRSKNSKKPDIPPEQRQPAASDGIAVRGADGKEYIVPRSAQDAYGLYQAASMDSVYGFLCALHCVNRYYEVFQSVPNGFQASATEPNKDADRFFDACEFVALAYAGGIEGVCEQDDAKAVHYYEILLEVCMSVLNRKRFKSEDDHYIFLCWEKLADAYSTGRGCTPNHEKAKEYYKYAVASAMGEGSDDAENDVPKQTRIIGNLLAGYPRPTAIYAPLAMRFATEMVKRGNIEGAALVEDYLNGVKPIGEEKLGLDPKQDFALYYKAAKEDGSAYACYRLALCYLTGAGTERNEATGRHLMRAAAEAGELFAAEWLASEENAEQAKWQGAVRSIRDTLRAHLAVMQGVTGVELPKPPRVTIDLPEEEEEEDFESRQREESPRDEYNPCDEYKKTRDLSRLPSIVYDDGNNRWQRVGIYGSQAVYHNDDGQEITIFHAEISRSSALTNAGTLHWY